MGFPSLASTNTPSVQVWDLAYITAVGNSVSLENDCAPYQLFLVNTINSAINVYLPSAPAAGKSIKFKVDYPVLTSSTSNNGSVINIIDPASSATIAQLGSPAFVELVYAPQAYGMGQNSAISSSNKECSWVTFSNTASYSALNVGASALGGSFTRAAPTSSSGSAIYATVCGGRFNTSRAQYAFVGGGTNNTADGDYSVIVGGQTNATNTTGYGFIGGGQNINASGAHCVVVGGQSITASGAKSFIGGGFGHNASGNYSVIVGGGDGTVGGKNIASGLGSAILSGLTNTASGNYTVIGGGYNNQATTNTYAVIVGGSSNTSSGLNSFIGGGDTNTASSSYSFVGGGGNNQAKTNTYAAVAGGSTNIATGQYSFIGGGGNNAADGTYGTIPGGFNATTRGLYGAHCYASGIFATQGDAQTMMMQLRRQSTDGTGVVLTSNAAAAGTTNQVILPNNASYVFRARVVARQSAGSSGTVGDSSMWDIVGAIKRVANAASTTLVGVPTVTLVGQDAAAAAWTVVLTADTTNGGLTITCTGEANKTINWVATVDTTEQTA